MAAVRSGSSLSTVSPSVPQASNPGEPSSVLTGIRRKIDSKGSKSGGNWTIGSPRGRKPRDVETMNAGRESSFGFVSERTLKEDRV